MDAFKSVFALIGAIATSAAAIYGIWRAFSGQKRLKVTAMRDEFVPMPEAAKEKEALLEKLREMTWATSSTPAKREVVEEIKASLPRSIFGAYGEPTIFYLKHNWIIDIENIGKAEVKEATVHIPFKGVYFIADSTEENATPLSKEIKLNPMRARAKVRIRMWTDSFYASRGEIYVSHADGAIEATILDRRISEVLYDKFCFAFKFTLMTVIGPIVGITVAAVLLSFNKNSASHGQSTTQPTTQPTNH